MRLRKGQTCLSTHAESCAAFHAATIRPSPALSNLPAAVDGRTCTLAGCPGCSAIYRSPKMGHQAICPALMALSVCKAAFDDAEYVRWPAGFQYSAASLPKRLPWQGLGHFPFAFHNP